MKKLKEFLDLIVSFAKAWRYLLGFLILITSIVTGFATDIAKITIQLKVPLLAMILVISLALYPIAKFFEWLLKKKSVKLFSFSGLMWKPAYLSFFYPTPICPHSGCDCQVYYKTDSSISVKPISGTIHFQARNEYLNFYECPKHGRLNVPNIDFNELREKAKIFQKSINLL